MSSMTSVSATRIVAPVAPFDPPGDVPTTVKLDAYYDHGRPMLNNYTRYAKVGGGQHGEVYLCYKLNPRLPHGHPERRIPVAMKSVRRDNPRAERWRKLKQQRLPASQHTPLADKLNTTEANIRKEIAIMKKCRHPHVVRLYEIIDDRMRDKIYMVMEYLGGGEVKWRNDSHQPILTVDQTRRILRDAILGLEYLHHQGIIHRDIKPANLLWTEDRRQVKIGDFGVSHFSYAQRLAAAGGDNSTVDPHDPILLDDSDLTKRAGTPSFLAPEIVFEHTIHTPSTTSSNLHAEGSTASHNATSLSLPAPTSSLTLPRPPITKAIDIWALGVTLYCLLFGRTPFVADPAVSAGSEWSLYNSICNQDWTPDANMGFDQIPTGGRHPIGNGSQGAIVVTLLNQLLQKDVKSRITLDELKRSSWFLRDLPDPKRWLQVTSPGTKIHVSPDETSDAMSNVHFRWRWGAQITRRLSSLLRIRTQRSREVLVDEGRGLVISEPQLDRPRMLDVQSSAGSQSQPSNQAIKPDKGKQRRIDPPPPLEHRPISKGSRSKSIDRWPSPGKPSSQGIGIQGSSSKARRGSETVLMDRAGPSSVVVTPASTSGVGTPLSPASSEKPRARFALFLSSITHWRPNKFSPHSGMSPTSPTGPFSNDTVYPQQHAQSLTQQQSGTVGGRAISRRSDEALRHYHSNQGEGVRDYEESGILTAARRASSWGQGDHPSEFMDAASVYSAGELNDNTMNVGAGGVSNDRSFVPRTSSKLANDATSMILTPATESISSSSLERQAFGPPCYDEDSSTIASQRDSLSGQQWQNGHEYDEDEDEDEDGDGDEDDDDDERTEEDGDREETVEGDEDDDDDEGTEEGIRADVDEDDSDDHGVMFAPRKRPNEVEPIV